LSSRWVHHRWLGAQSAHIKEGIVRAASSAMSLECKARWAWNAKIDDMLLSLGFHRTPSKHAIYVRWNGNMQLVVRVYVDHLIITGSDCDNIRSFKEEMAAKFKMSDLSLLHYYLAIEVKQSAIGILLSQGVYAIKFLERSGMIGCNPYHVPMEARLKLSKQSIVRSLRYLLNTRHDLAFVVGYMSHFLEEPREDHLAVVKKILCYVAGTCNWGLWFGQKKGNQTLLIMFSDADFVGDIDVRKSTIWVIFFLVNRPITWQSTKQKVETQSSCESEYIAVANAMCGVLWLARVLAEV
jgi:hypothetical protein